MTELQTFEKNQLVQFQQSAEQEYSHVAANKMSLDLSRGKPAADQLDLSNNLENCIAGNYLAEDGTDTRNYGGLRGLPEARLLGEEIMGVPSQHIMAAGNSSLSLMHLTVLTALSQGLWQDQRHWSRSTTVKLLAPVPGYDRHFVLSDALGIELVNVNMTTNGPDMDEARKLVAADPSIKGIWCVPKYSNPTGITFSAQVVDEIAQLPNLAAADDFVVLWDNAYAVHDLEFPGEELASLWSAGLQHNTSDHLVQYASTSKITFAGAGLSFVAASNTVLTALESQMSVMTIGADKVNQLRHARFLKGRVAKHMQAHANLLKPKFDLVLEILQRDLGGLGIAQWTTPKGGYFISLDVLPGLAREVIRLAKEVGLTLTPAGATFPNNLDPLDQNVRIAPTYASLQELKPAMEILTLCVRLASSRYFAQQTQ